MSQQKKIQKAYDYGFYMGARDNHEFWLQVIRETPGIGNKLTANILETAAKLAKRRVRE